MLSFESVINQLDAGVIVLDDRAAVVSWNDWIERASGVSRDAALGKTLSEVFPELSDSRLLAVIDEALRIGNSSILTHTLNKLLPLRSEDGQALLHNVVVRPAPMGETIACMVQITDVTVAVIRERVLRERQNARYHAIVDSATDPIVTADAEGKIHWVNAACERVFGFRAAELLGKGIDTLLDEPGALTAGLADIALGTDATVVKGRQRDGRIADFGVSFGRWRSDDRLFVTTIWRDLTDRMAAEVALRESERRQRALLEALPQLVWACGSNGDCDYFNPQWRVYTGAAPEEHLGWGWLKVAHPDDREALERAWRAALSGGGPFDVDARLRRADGAYHWFKLRAIPLRDRDAATTRWFGTATEIGDLVEARETLRRSNSELEQIITQRTHERELVLRQLHESQKMESIGQLTGGVAHDFNNLLAVVLGSLRMLKKRLPDDPRVTTLIEGAIQGAERGATLTKRLLAFARRQDLKPEAVEISELIPNLTDFLRQAVGPNISVDLVIGTDVHPVKIDSNQFELALMNLAVNARDAMPNGGRLVITCHDADSPVTLGDCPPDQQSGKYVCIGIADTGAGMDAETLAKATEPFFTTKGVGKGTGLGLSMVHGLMAQSGGSMQITSEVGKGTLVTLWLPQAERDKIARSLVQSVPQSVSFARSTRILLVDDDSLVGTNTGYMLADLGHSAVHASSGHQALRILETDPKFDVVITDYAMPGMNGLDLAKAIRELHPEMKIIIASGYAEVSQPVTLEFARLNKPYSTQELAIALQ
jgi:PAS domain S-box-containing protein